MIERLTTPSAPPSDEVVTHEAQVMTREAELMNAVQAAREITRAADAATRRADAGIAEQHFRTPYGPNGMPAVLMGGESRGDAKLEVAQGGDYRHVRAEQVIHGADGSKTYLEAHLNNDPVTGTESARARRVGPDGQEVYDRRFDDPVVIRKIGTLLANRVTERADSIRARAEEKNPS
jgi:hypothetical protein